MDQSGYTPEDWLRIFVGQARRASSHRHPIGDVRFLCKKSIRSSDNSNFLKSSLFALWKFAALNATSVIGFQAKTFATNWDEKGARAFGSFSPQVLLLAITNILGNMRIQAKYKEIFSVPSRDWRRRITPLYVTSSRLSVVVYFYTSLLYYHPRNCRDCFAEMHGNSVQVGSRVPGNSTTTFSTKRSHTQKYTHITLIRFIWLMLNTKISPRTIITRCLHIHECVNVKNKKKTQNPVISYRQRWNDLIMHASSKYKNLKVNKMSI